MSRYQDDYAVQCNPNPPRRSAVNPMPKTMTVRLTDEQARDLESVARVEEMPVSEAVRLAIDEHIKARREDQAFQSRLRRIIEENQEALERLAQ